MGTADERERLARIETKIDYLLDRADRSEELHDAIEGRLRAVETSSAKHGALYGGLVAVGISFITSIAKIKAV